MHNPINGHEHLHTHTCWHTTRAHSHDIGNVSVSFSLVNTNIYIFFDHYTFITLTTHLVSVFSACRIVMHSGQTQSSVGAASSWMQRKWYTRGHVSQLITTPSLWHNQQNWSVEDPTAGNAVATGDCCCKQNFNNKMLYKQGSITITFTYTKCQFLTTVMKKFHAFWDITHVDRQTATDVLEKHTASIYRFLLDCYTMKKERVGSSDTSVTIYRSTQLVSSSLGITLSIWYEE